MTDIDEVDAEILDCLQRNGRLSNAKLAKQVSLRAGSVRWKVIRARVRARASARWPSRAAKFVDCDTCLRICWYIRQIFQKQAVTQRLQPMQPILVLPDSRSADRHAAAAVPAVPAQRAPVATAAAHV